MPSDVILEERKIDTDELEAFIKHPGWRWLCEQIEARINAGLNELLNPVTPDTIYRAEFIKGQMKAWNDIAALPRITYEEKLDHDRTEQRSADATGRTDLGGDFGGDFEWDRPV
jgi:hypothetical protein